MIFIRVSAGVEVLKYVWEERWTSINFPHDKYYRLSCNQYTALHYCYITRFLCIFQQFFCLWLIGEAQFPNIQHESLLYPGRGAAGYEYCGLMMNVANIETQYRERESYTSWYGNIVCPLSKDVQWSEYYGDRRLTGGHLWTSQLQIWMSRREREVAWGGDSGDCGVTKVQADLLSWHWGRSGPALHWSQVRRG